MSTYAIYLNHPNQAVWNIIATTWPGRHRMLDDRLAFVAPMGITTSAEIAQAIGMTKEVDHLSIAHSNPTGGGRREWR